MKINRKDIQRKIQNQVQLISQNIQQHEEQRKKHVGTNEKEAAYHWGRISGLNDAINYLHLVSDYLGEK
jgi:hypothetical protein